LQEKIVHTTLNTTLINFNGYADHHRHKAAEKSVNLPCPEDELRQLYEWISAP